MNLKNKEFEKSSLNGLRVLVTRPTLQAQGLVTLLHQHNGRAVEFPTIEIKPLELPISVRRIIENLDQYAQVIFVSSNAARIGCDLFVDYWPQWPLDIDWIAVGDSTAKVMSDQGLMPIVPDSHNSEGLLELLQLKNVSGNKILIVRGLGGRPLLAETLTSRGGIVELAEIYQRKTPAYNDDELLAILSPSKLDIVLVTSVESLTNLCAIVGDDLTQLQQIPLLVVSERIALIAKKAGFGNVSAGSETLLTANGASDQAILNALQQYVKFNNKSG